MPSRLTSEVAAFQLHQSCLMQVAAPAARIAVMHELAGSVLTSAVGAAGTHAMKQHAGWTNTP